MNQEEADQDVADEVDSRGKVMRCEKNDWYNLRRSEFVDEQE